MAMILVHISTVKIPMKTGSSSSSCKNFLYFFMLFFYYFVIFFILFSIFILLVHNVHKGSSHFAQIVSNMYIQQKRHAMSCISAVQGEKIITSNLLYSKYKIFGTLLSTKTSKIHITLFIHC